MEKKHLLRKKLIEQRDGMESRIRYEKSKEIGRKCISWLEENSCDQVFLFCSMGSEVETKFIATYCLENNIRLGYPKVEQKEMNFYEYSHMDQMVPGPFGILEPTGKEEPLCPDAKTVIFVPGLGFDVWHQRIGYGGGYYDRYLTKASSATCIGICFADLVSSLPLPITCYDQPVHLVITERGIL